MKGIRVNTYARGSSETQQTTLWSYPHAIQFYSKLLKSHKNQVYCTILFVNVTNENTGSLASKLMFSFEL